MIVIEVFIWYIESARAFCAVSQFSSKHRCRCSAAHPPIGCLGSNSIVPVDITIRCVIHHSDRATVIGSPVTHTNYHHEAGERVDTPLGTPQLDCTAVSMVRVDQNPHVPSCDCRKAESLESASWCLCRAEAASLEHTQHHGTIECSHQQ